MDSTKIRTLYDDYMALSSFFYSQNQISFATCINDVYRKSLLISAASFFEVEICKAIYDAAEKKGKANRAFVNFIENKVITRQYHTFLLGIHLIQIIFGAYLERISKKIFDSKLKKEN